MGRGGAARWLTESAVRQPCNDATNCTVDTRASRCPAGKLRRTVAKKCSSSILMSTKTYSVGSLHRTRGEAQMPPPCTRRAPRAIDGHKARVAVVNQKVGTQRLGSHVVDAARAVRHVPHDERLGAGKPLLRCGWVRGRRQGGGRGGTRMSAMVVANRSSPSGIWSATCAPGGPLPVGGEGSRCRHSPAWLRPT